MSTSPDTLSHRVWGRVATTAFSDAEDSDSQDRRKNLFLPVAAWRSLETLHNEWCDRMREIREITFAPATFASRGDVLIAADATSRERLNHLAQEYGPEPVEPGVEFEYTRLVGQGWFLKACRVERVTIHVVPE